VPHKVLRQIRHIARPQPQRGHLFRHKQKQIRYLP
jgi:hypothetical protein